jgi:hypothetical protein
MIQATSQRTKKAREPRGEKPESLKPGVGEYGLATLHNELARCQTDIGVLGMRLILFLAARIRKEDLHFKPIRLRVTDCQEKLGLSGNSAYKNLYDVVKRLMGTVVVTPDPVGDETMFQVLAPSKAKPGKGEFEVRFNEEMRPLLLSLRALFCQIPLEYFFRIQGAYAVRFYLFCKSWDPTKHKSPGWRMTVEELRAWLGIEEDQYEKLFHLRAAVLERAKEELDRVADVSFEYEPITEGGRTVGWSFTPYKNRPKGRVTRRGRPSKSTASQPKLPFNLEEPPPKPDFEPMARLWAEATESQRMVWLEDDLLRQTAPKNGEPPRPIFLARLSCLTQPAEAGP